MTITKASAQLSLLGTATPTRTNVSNSVAIGAALATKSYTDATAVYSVKATATTTSDVCSIYLASADKSTSGSPTVVDDGVDFEGKDIGTLGTIYAVLVEQLVDGAMFVDGDFTEMRTMTKAGDKALWVWESGVSVSSQVVTLDLNATGVSAKVTVIGKT